jgi:hypothetical protein
MVMKKTNSLGNVKLLDSANRQIDGLSERLFQIIALYNPCGLLTVPARKKWKMSHLKLEKGYQAC